MARMVRKQFYIDEPTERALTERADTLGVQQAELVRQALRAFLQGGAAGERRQAAWKSFADFTRERAAGGFPQAPRAWTREDAHGR